MLPRIRVEPWTRVLLDEGVITEYEGLKMKVIGTGR